ncbi:MAG: hypothetical protein M3O46_06090 [Myxococcota bacterium]|nr:hypothetical protein [Myxococcota bacterium]
MVAHFAQRAATFEVLAVIRQTSTVACLATLLRCSSAAVGTKAMEEGTTETGTSTDATSIQVADGAAIADSPAIDASNAPASDAADVVSDARASKTDAGNACLPLTSQFNPCPADWNAALADKATFCKSSPLPYPMFDAFISLGPCRGFLRYTKHLWDGGPRDCIYHPSSLMLSGYDIVDGKAMFVAHSCGTIETDFVDSACAGSTCAPVDASPDEGG